MLARSLSCSEAVSFFIVSTSSGLLISLQSFACVEVVMLTCGGSNAGRFHVFSVSVLDPSHMDFLFPVQSSSQTDLVSPFIFTSQAEAFLPLHSKGVMEFSLLSLRKTSVDFLLLLTRLAQLDFSIFFQSASCLASFLFILGAIGLDFTASSKNLGRSDFKLPLNGPTCLEVMLLAKAVAEVNFMLLLRSFG